MLYILTHFVEQDLADVGAVPGKHQAHAEALELGFRLLFHADGLATRFERVEPVCRAVRLRFPFP